MEDYKIITQEQLKYLLDAWELEQPVERCCYLVEPVGKDGYIAVDNTTGDFFIEEFRTKALCLEYFEGEQLDELYQKNCC